MLGRRAGTLSRPGAPARVQRRGVLQRRPSSSPAERRGRLVRAACMRAGRRRRRRITTLRTGRAALRHRQVVLREVPVTRVKGAQETRLRPGRVFRNARQGAKTPQGRTRALGSHTWRASTSDAQCKRNEKKKRESSDMDSRSCANALAREFPVSSATRRKSSKTRSSDDAPALAETRTWRAGRDSI